MGAAVENRTSDSKKTSIGHTIEGGYDTPEKVGNKYRKSAKKSHLPAFTDARRRSG